MNRIFLRLMSPFFALVLLTVPAVGAAQQAAVASTDKEARANFNLGRTAYDEGRYRPALEYFKHAYALSGRPKLLYNVAQACERLQQDEDALEAYRRYLAELPDAANRSVVERRIEILESARPSKPVVIPTPAEVARETIQPSNKVITVEPPGDYNVLEQWWFWSAVGAVVVGATVGVAVAASGGGDDVEPMLPGDDGVVVRALRF